MYLDIVRIGEKVMESCWYSLCVYKKKKKRKRKEIQIYIVKREEMKKLKTNANQRSK